MIASPACPPRTSVFLQMRPGLAGCTLRPVPSARNNPWRRSTMPSTPNVGIVLPVVASICLEEAVHREDQPAVLAVFALPVVHPLAVDPAQPVVDPDLLAGGRVQRDDRRVVPAEPVEHVTSVDRTEDRRAVRIVPSHLELADVGLGDLLDRPEVRAVRPRQAPVHRDSGRRRGRPDRRMWRARPSRRKTGDVSVSSCPL